MSFADTISEPFDERETMRIFERDVLPLAVKWGPYIGEAAMQGDAEAEQIIRRHHIFNAWLDPVNLNMLTVQLRQWVRKKEH